MNIAFLDESLASSLTATLIEAFGEACWALRPDTKHADLPRVPASHSTWKRELTAAGAPLKRAPKPPFARVGISALEDVMAALVLDAVERAHWPPAPRSRSPTTATGSPLPAFTARARPPAYRSSDRILAPFDPLPASGMVREYRDQLSFPYMARRIALLAPVDSSAPDRIAAISRALEGTPAAASVIHHAPLGARRSRSG